MIVPGQIETEPAEESVDYMSTEFSIGGTTFFVGRFKAMHGWAVLESFREALANVQGNISLSKASMTQGLDTNLQVGDFIEILGKIFLSLETRYVNELRQCLFEITQFQTKSTNKRQALLGAEDMAFDGLPPGAVYDVMGRVFSVNFTESLPIVLSVFRQALITIISNMNLSESEGE